MNVGQVQPPPTNRPNQHVQDDKTGASAWAEPYRRSAHRRSTAQCAMGLPFVSLCLLVLARAACVSCIAWHKGTPHKHYHSPACAFAPPHGNSDCSSDCGQAANLQRLVARGVKVPAAANIVSKFQLNCTHIMSGCKSDGVGSQMQGKLSAYAYAAAKGMKYVHFPIVRSGGHFSSQQEEDKVVKEVEEFFNFGMGEMSLEEAANKNVQLCAVEHCHVFMDEGGEGCYDEIKSQIRRKYESSPKPLPLHNPTRISVVLHVRRGDVSNQAGLQQPHYDLRFSPDNYYIDTLAAIKKSLPDKLRGMLEIVLLSEGKTSDFDAILAAHPTARLVLSGDLLQVLHTMVTADILVIAHSSFSFTPALYSNGIVVYNHFWHSPLPGWLKNPWPPQKRPAGVEEDIPCRALMHRLNTSDMHGFLERRWRSRNPHSH